MNDEELLDILMNAEIKFWACPDCPQQIVKWAGEVATCQNCGKTNAKPSERGSNGNEDRPNKDH